jgi:Fe-S cluster biogenesis protein NfuA
MAASIDQLLRICREVLSPLVRADGGELYVVAVEPDSIALHLAGTCSGCPGKPYTTSAIIEPAIYSVAPSARVIVTSGANIPDGASKIS